MEVRNPNETKRELEILFTESVGRLLNPLEEEIIADIAAYPDEKRIAFLEYMKEMSNKQRQLK
ncbi:hypothetical protein FC682_15715 [Peribacillus simplex]|uniref:Uncharacterized protein n=1 Tax=Peribacillus simplex TaxID=1478 RepID=A0A9X9EQL6_9BACI|nr:hypothetical protein [Peribacillus simplex]TKH04150.1 hypothetical protein FC682_15715 [Peribacillus simplex]TKH07863.1 hypothetical protein FC678_22070 [Peribacillus simplex]